MPELGNNEISVHIGLDWNWPTGSELGKMMTISKKKITQKMIKSLWSLAYQRDSLTFHIYASEDNNSRRTIWPKKRVKFLRYCQYETYKANIVTLQPKYL